MKMISLALSVCNPIYQRRGVPAAVAPVLTAGSPLVTDNGDGTGTLALTTDTDATLYVWIGPTGTTPTAQEVRDGTGADGTITQAITAAGSTYALDLPDGLSGDYRVSVVAQDGTGPLSNVLTQSPVAFDTVVAPPASDPAINGVVEDQPKNFATSVNATAPTSTVTGDRLLFIIHGDTGTAPTVTPPAGFTLVATTTCSDGWARAYEGVATAGGAGSYSFGVSPQNDVSFTALRFDPTGAISAADAQVAANRASAQTHPTIAASGLVAGDLVLDVLLLPSGDITGVTINGAAPDVLSIPTGGSAATRTTLAIDAITATGATQASRTWDPFADASSVTAGTVSIIVRKA